MNKATEQQFEKIAQIAQETIKQAEAVKCSFDEFIEGLKSIGIEINDRLSCALFERVQDPDDD